MNSNKISLKDLYITFAKIGLFTFGGGMAMLPIIEKEIVDKKKWITYDELVDYYAISQSTPGIIMVNISTFCGYNKRGIIGAIISTLGVITPSLIIITSIATLISNFSEISYIKSALKGINAGICAVIINSIYKMARSSIKDILGIILAIITFLLAYFTNISVIYFVPISILIGIIKYKLGVKK